MCLAVTEKGLQVLKRIKSRTRPFYAYSIKLQLTDGKLVGVFFAGAGLGKGINIARNHYSPFGVDVCEGEAIAAFYPTTIVPNVQIGDGYHLTFCKKNLLGALKKYNEKAKYSGRKPYVMVKVKVCPQDVVAVGCHNSGNQSLDIMERNIPVSALVAKQIEWDGNIEECSCF